MSSDSPFFDRIRVKPDQDRRLRAEHPCCEWPGCNGAATHRAPKGRTREKEYWRFCLDHVREYNHSYNFFAGMSDDDIASYQKDAVVGHRPTWKMGMNGGKPSTRSHSARFQPSFDADDPLDLFRHFGADAARAMASACAGAKAASSAMPSARRSTPSGLEPEATTHEIKVRFKMLVKRHHPDANGGDRSTEDRLREIIQAYKYLKSVGFR